MTRTRHRGHKNLTDIAARAAGGNVPDGLGNSNVLKAAGNRPSIGIIGGKGAKTSMADAHGGAIKATKRVKRANGGAAESKAPESKLGNKNVYKAADRGAAFDAYSSAGKPTDGYGERKDGGATKRGR